MEPKLLKIEIERIVNLVAGFGWVKSEEKISAEKVTLTLEKRIAITEEP
ncbi:hypothetical protein ES703_10464 [subsurface metagenome]